MFVSLEHPPKSIAVICYHVSVVLLNHSYL